MEQQKIKSISHSRRINFILVLFLLQLFSTEGYTKAIIYDGRDGLSSNSIRAIAKDSRGLMWIGTYNGLNIYDGYTFTKFKGVLSTLTIKSLAIQESRNQILVGTSEGLYVINLTTLASSKCEQPKGKKGIWPNGNVASICVIPGQSKAYASFGKDIVASVNENNELEILLKLSDGTKSINSIISKDSNNLLISNSDVYNFNLSQKKCELVPELKSKAPVSTFYKSGDRLLLYSLTANLLLYNIHTFKDEMPASVKNIHNRLTYTITQCSIKENKLYILSANYSFYIVNLKNGAMTEVSRKYPDIFEGKVCHTLFVDEHGIIWIATNKGLIKIEERPALFTRSLYNFPARVSTRKMLEEESGDLYVCSYSGLWYYKRLTQEWARYQDPIIEYKTNNTVRVQPQDILPDSSGNYFFVAFDSERLIRFNKKKKAFENFPYAEELNGEMIKGMFTMVRDAKGKIWVGCGNGLASYKPVEQKFTLHVNDAFDIGRCRVRYLYKKRGNNLLYVATDSGLYWVDADKGIIKQFNTNTEPALSNNDVLFIDEDKKGNLWMGTNGGGINILSANGKNIRKIRKQNGLSNEVVYTIIPEDDHTYWISTFNGLDRYRSDLQSFSNFFEEDGLGSDEFNQNSFLKTSKGEILFGSINGLISFYPQKIGPATSFSIFLSGISKWDNQTQSFVLARQKIDAHTKIVKKPSDQLMELHFGCTDYSDPLRNSYSYRIKQITDNWISLEDRHTINLGGLPYGTYTIEVRAINSRGGSSVNTLLFTVKLLQPFYRTWWFYTLALLAIAAIFYTAYLIKYQNFKNVLHLRMKIASNLHDEVGSLLTRITMFSDNLRYSRNSEEQKNFKLEKIALLSRDAVTSMSDVLWAIDSRNDFAGNLLDRMREHAEDMLFPLGIDVNFVVSGTDLKQPITSDTRGEIYLIFKEAVNNIVRHSSATIVDITYKINDKNFLLRIANNGAKLDTNEISTGQGLNNMKMRANKIGAEIGVEKKENQFVIEVKN